MTKSTITRSTNHWDRISQVVPMILLADAMISMLPLKLWSIDSDRLALEVFSAFSSERLKDTVLLFLFTGFGSCRHLEDSSSILSVWVETELLAIQLENSFDCKHFRSFFAKVFDCKNLRSFFAKLSVPHIFFV